MRCWNCYRNIPDQAKVCGFCEAEATTEAPSPEEMEAAEKMLKEMPPETLMELERVFRDTLPLRILLIESSSIPAPNAVVQRQAIAKTTLTSGNYSSAAATIAVTFGVPNAECS